MVVVVYYSSFIIIGLTTRSKIILSFDFLFILVDIQSSNFNKEYMDLYIPYTYSIQITKGVQSLPFGISVLSEKCKNISILPSKRILIRKVMPMYIHLSTIDG